MSSACENSESSGQTTPVRARKSRKIEEISGSSRKEELENSPTTGTDPTPDSESIPTPKCYDQELQPFSHQNDCFQT